MPRKKPSSSSSPSPATGSVEKAFSVMKGCVDALRACKKGSHSRAIKIIQEVCRGKTNCEDPYIIQGKIFTDYVREIADGRLKHRILKEAAESCKRATELYPYSIDLGFAYAGFLYELCDFGSGYEELAQECKRALSIEPEAHNSSGKGMGSGGFEPDLTVEETREGLLAMLEVCQWKINEMVLNEGRAYTEDVMVMKQRVQIYLNSMVDTEKTELVRVVLISKPTLRTIRCWVLRYPRYFLLRRTSKVGGPNWLVAIVRIHFWISCPTENTFPTRAWRRVLLFPLS